MFTSESKEKNALIYLIISIVIGAAGAVYEHFSFGVYSNFMIYAFAIPLIGGTLPYTAEALRESGGKARSVIGTLLECWTYHAAIATLTVGSIMQGVLAICGRPNGLVIAYPITAAALLAAAALESRGCIRLSRIRI